MLPQRILTALILLPAVLALVWYAPTPWLFVALGVVALGMAWEWSALAERAASAQRAQFVLATLAVLLLFGLFPALRVPMSAVLLIGSGAWWLATPWLFAGFPSVVERMSLRAPAIAVLGLLLITATVIAATALHAQPQGPLKLLYVFFLVFCADTGAYFAGRRFGRHKLAPAISPGKTVEGAVGGLLLCAVWAGLAGPYVFATEGGATLLLVGVSMLAAAASIAGDLSESMFKRLAGLKDSGRLLPGHGGLLDRTDSLMAALPVMWLGLRALGWA